MGWVARVGVGVGWVMDHFGRPISRIKNSRMESLKERLKMEK